MIEDSPRRCPRDGKRMLVDLGQADSTGMLDVWHECWNCGYREPEQWPSARVKADAP